MVSLASIALMAFLYTGCPVIQDAEFAPSYIIDNVYDHIVAFAVYYYMPPEEWERRTSKQGLSIKDPVKRIDMEGYAVPIEDEFLWKGKPAKCIAYIGSGCVVSPVDEYGRNYVLSARHLFKHDENTYDSVIYMAMEGVNKFIEGEIIAISDGEEEWDDYAVVRMKAPLYLRGLRIAFSDPKPGERVIFGSGVGGSAFFVRFGFASRFHKFFRKDEEGQLHLSHWNAFQFITVYPGGGGDSGSVIVNTKGRICGLVYCGVSIYDETYLFSNPIGKLHEFLRANQLEWLGK
jgi:hypothetical protein